jgi:hypothetical protein
MPCRTARWAVPGAAALVLACAALAGCGAPAAPVGSPGAPSPAASSPSAGHASANTGKLTGNFCTDFKNIGTSMPIPASATGSLIVYPATNCA